MMRILLLLFLFSLPAHAGVNYKTWDKLPCSFNGAKVTTTATPNAPASKGPCQTGGKGYAGKMGTTIMVKRGTPIFAVKDMELLFASDYSSKYNCVMENLSQTNTDFNRRVKHPDTGKNLKCKSPWDGMSMTFRTVDGEMVLYYHMMTENPLVPGFGQGECAIRMFYRHFYSGQRLSSQVSEKMCGGIKKKYVKKGEFIGYVGSTGGKHGDHVSFNINQGWGWLHSPEGHSLGWESYPTDSNKFLLPIMSKKYLKEIGFNK